MRTAGPISVKFFVSCSDFRGEGFYGRKFWKIPPEKSENWKNRKSSFCMKFCVKLFLNGFPNEKIESSWCKTWKIAENAKCGKLEKSKIDFLYAILCAIICLSK